MAPTLHDPNNHSPEVSPDDVWGDVHVVHPSGQGNSTVLPPKKDRARDSASPRATRKETEGLRIESKTPVRQNEGLEPQLEIQEINGSVVRLNPEMPTAEKVPRQYTFQQRPTASSEKPWLQAESKALGKSRNYALRWILGTSFGVASLVIGTLVLLPMINQSNAARPNSNRNGLVIESIAENEENPITSDLLARQAEAEQLFLHYASAPIVDDVLPLLSSADSVEALVRSQPKAYTLPKEWIPPKNTKWNVIEIHEMPFGLLEGRLPDHSKFSAFMAISDGNLFLDWKATSAYGTATFEELAQNHGDPSEIRGWISPANFYTANFPEEQFRSYRFLNRAKKTSVWCYAPITDPVAEKLGQLFPKGTILKSDPSAERITLRLKRGPSEAPSNQWLIEQLLHRDWITP